MLSSNETNDLTYEEICQTFSEFSNTKDVKILAIFDSCKSYIIWEKLCKIVPKSRIKNVSFLGYLRNGHVWKYNNNYCVPLGGVLGLIFQNSLALFQEHKTKRLPEIFVEEANKIVSQVFNIRIFHLLYLNRFKLILQMK